MEDEAICAVVTRLARPHRSGGHLIERAAILAEGADFAEVMEWIIARGATPEAVVAAPSRGLHERRLDVRSGVGGPTPARFVLPPGALNSSSSSSS